MEAARADLEQTQQRLAEIDQQLSERSRAAQEAEAKLQNSRGAARDYYISKLEKERAATAKLQQQKAQAAKEEAQQQKELQRLEKESQKIAAATTLASNVATAAKAVEAGVNAVAGASALPFPANIPAIIAALAAVASAVASAKNFATVVKYADGGALKAGVLYGPSHAQGGIPFTIDGRAGFEAEAGEGILPKNTMQHNFGLFELLRTAGRTKQLSAADLFGSMQVLPPPAPVLSGKYASGGQLPNGGNTAATATATASAAVSNEKRLIALEQRQARTNELLEQIVKSSAAAAARPVSSFYIGPYEATKIEEQRQTAVSAQQAVTL
jgi:hypothetical protein